MSLFFPAKSEKATSKPAAPAFTMLRGLIVCIDRPLWIMVKSLDPVASTLFAVAKFTFRVIVLSSLLEPFRTIEYVNSLRFVAFAALLTLLAPFGE